MLINLLALVPTSIGDPSQVPLALTGGGVLALYVILQRYLPKKTTSSCTWEDRFNKLSERVTRGEERQRETTERLNRLEPRIGG